MPKYAQFGMFFSMWTVTLLHTSTLIADDPECDYLVSEIKTVYFGIEVPTPNPDHPMTISSGHTDIDVPYRDCDWTVEVSPDSGQIPTESALIYAGTQARVTLASIPPGFEFIGATPNMPFWILPQNPASGVIYLGIASESMTLDDRSRLCEWNPNDPRGGADIPAKWIRIELIDVRGPIGGQFAVWQTSGPGQVSVFMSTANGGITPEDSCHVLAGSHSHVNWAFTQPGLYAIDFRMSTLVAPLKGDLACDCVVDMLDIPAFVEALLSPDSYVADYPDCNIQNANVNGDDSIDGADVQAFVDLFLS